MGVETILVNLRKAAFDRRRTEIGGGTFTHVEVQELLDYIEELRDVIMQMDLHEGAEGWSEDLRQRVDGVLR